MAWGGLPPPLRLGQLDAELIEPIRINFNPACGRTVRPADFPEGYGCDAIGPHQSDEVRASFARDGIQNPVFLWARFNRIWVRLGGSRVHFARGAGLHVPALVADYDDRFPHWPEIPLDEVLSQFVEPEVGVVPYNVVVHGDRVDLEVVLWRDYLSSRS